MISSACFCVHSQRDDAASGSFLMCCSRCVCVCVCVCASVQARVMPSRESEARHNPAEGGAHNGSPHFQGLIEEMIACAFGFPALYGRFSNAALAPGPPAV